MLLWAGGPLPCHVFHSFPNGFGADKRQRHKPTCVEPVMHILYWVCSCSILYRTFTKTPHKTTNGERERFRYAVKQGAEPVRLTQKPMFFLLPCFSKDPGKSNGRELFLYPSGQKTVKVGIAFPRFFRVWVRTEGDSRKPFASVIALQLQGLAQCLAHSRHSRMKKIVRYLYLSNSYTNFTFTLNNKKLKVSSFLKIASLSFFQ